MHKQPNSAGSINCNAIENPHRADLAGHMRCAVLCCAALCCAVLCCACSATLDYCSRGYRDECRSVLTSCKQSSRDHDGSQWSMYPGKDCECRLDDNLISLFESNTVIKHVYRMIYKGRAQGHRHFQASAKSVNGCIAHQ